MRTLQSQSYRDPVTPAISHLPVEIFSRIVILSVPVQSWSVKRLQELAQVSRYWKSVVCSTLQLWCVVRNPPDNCPCWHETLDLNLRMSMDMPLAVIYDQDPESDSSSKEEEFMTVVGKHSQRWQTIEYTGRWSPAIVVELQRPVPRLESLTLDWSHTTAYEPETSRSLVSAHGGLLRHVKLNSAYLPWSSLTGLTTLDVSNIYQSTSIVTEWLTVLRSNPSLELLYMRSIHKFDEGESHEEEPYVVGSVSNTQYIHLPHLKDFQASAVEASLMEALIATVHAPAVSSLSFTIGPPLAKVLSKADSTILFSPALINAIKRSGHVYVKIYDYYACIETYAGDYYMETHDVAEQGVFELGVRRYPHDDDSVLEGPFQFLHLERLHVPLHLQIGRNGSDSVQNINFGYHLLDQLPCLEELQLRKGAIGANGILVYLTIPRRPTELGELDWPCPRLTDLHVDGKVCSWEVLQRFLRERYGRGGREGSRPLVPGPAPLRALKLAGFHLTQEELDSISQMVDTVTLTSDDAL